LVPPSRLHGRRKTRAPSTYSVFTYVDPEPTVVGTGGTGAMLGAGGRAPWRTVLLRRLALAGFARRVARFAVCAALRVDFLAPRLALFRAVCLDLAVFRVDFLAARLLVFLGIQSPTPRGQAPTGLQR
jgi:hypothetical protein